MVKFRIIGYKGDLDKLTLAIADEMEKVRPGTYVKVSRTVNSNERCAYFMVNTPQEFSEDEVLRLADSVASRECLVFTKSGHK